LAAAIGTPPRRRAAAPPALKPAMATSSVLITTVHLKGVAILVLVYPGVSPFNGLHLVAIALWVSIYGGNLQLRLLSKAFDSLILVRGYVLSVHSYYFFYPPCFPFVRVSFTFSFCFSLLVCFPFPTALGFSSYSHYYRSYTFGRFYSSASSPGKAKATRKLPGRTLIRLLRSSNPLGQTAAATGLTKEQKGAIVFPPPYYLFNSRCRPPTIAQLYCKINNWL
jgi:hypothetical protein